MKHNLWLNKFKIFIYRDFHSAKPEFESFYCCQLHFAVHVRLQIYVVDNFCIPDAAFSEYRIKIYWSSETLSTTLLTRLGYALIWIANSIDIWV